MVCLIIIYIDIYDIEINLIDYFDELKEKHNQFYKYTNFMLILEIILSIIIIWNTMFYKWINLINGINQSDERIYTNLS